MKVYEIIDKAEFLEKEMNKYAKALALAMSVGRQESVIESLLKEYKSSRKEYYDYMDSNVNTN